MTAHRLAPLLTPRSIAIVGASTTPDSVGNTSVKMAKRGDYAGRIYPINPKYPEVEGLPCFPSLAALPESVDLAVLCVANQRMEAALADAIANKARAVAFFSSGHLDNDTNPPLGRRLAKMAKDAGVPICGGNCMGFYNLDIGLFLSFGWPPYKAIRGDITLLSHSGSSFSSLTLNDERLGYNLCVSAGLELTTTIADYMDYAMELHNTRAMGLILETVRDPANFIEKLKKAQEKEIPIVALKIGRTEESIKLAISHSGAIAGNDAAYEAVFERYGVMRVEALDEMAGTLAMFNQPRRAKKGGVVGILDSGAERELLIDLASDANVPLPKMTPATTAKLASLLDPGLEPVNPLDAWGTGINWEHIFTESFCALVGDPNTSIGVIFSSIRDHAATAEGWVRVVIEASKRFDKPLAVVTNFGWTRHGELTKTLTAAKIPTIEGTKCGLVALRKVLDHRDRAELPKIEPPKPVSEKVKARWRARLAQAEMLDEAEGLALLKDYGIPVPDVRVVEDEASALKAAKAVGFPVALKTAMPGIAHKSDVGGVKLGLADAKAVKAAYADLKKRLGARVLVAPMAPAGVEMALGMISDDQFGPLVVVGAGGIFIEILGDRTVALPNFDAPTARRYVDKLKTRALLDGKRGRPPSDVGSFAKAASRLSLLAHDLGDLLAELDVNPVIVGPKGAVAVDALVVPKAAVGVKHAAPKAKAPAKKAPKPKKAAKKKR